MQHPFGRAMDGFGPDDDLANGAFCTFRPLVCGVAWRGVRLFNVLWSDSPGVVGTFRIGPVTLQHS